MSAKSKDFMLNGNDEDKVDKKVIKKEILVFKK